MNARVPILCAIVYLVSFALFAAVPGAQAQRSRALATVTVPFAFHYNAQTFRAGEYSLRLVGDAILELRGTQGAAIGVVFSSDKERQPSTGRLVFHRYADGYALRDVWLPELAVHLSCPEARHHLPRELAQTQRQTLPDQVEIALTEPRH